MTRREMFEKLMTMSAIKSDTELLETVEKAYKAELKKSTNKKPTKNQEQNELYKACIITVLRDANAPLRVAEIQALHTDLATLSNQKMSALLSALIKDNEVIRISEKKIAKFAIIH